MEASFYGKRNIPNNKPMKDLLAIVNIIRFKLTIVGVAIDLKTTRDE